MGKYTNILQEKPPSRVIIDVIFDDNITRRMVYNDNLDCLEPVGLGTSHLVSVIDSELLGLIQGRELKAIAWRKAEGRE